MAQVGMDVEAVKAFANKLKQKADTSLQEFNTLNNECKSLDWKGADHEKANGDLDAAISTLKTAMDKVQDMAQRITQQADEQAQTSSR